MPNDEGKIVMLKESSNISIGGLGALLAIPSLRGVGDDLVMRGSIVGKDPTGLVMCVGEADDATVGKVFDV